MKKILVSDYTLPMLTESENLLFREKTAIAAAIDRIGVDRMELPAIRRPREDAIIYRTIASLVQNCELAIPVGYDEAGVLSAWECVKQAAKPCLQVVLPVATARMEYSFRAKEAAMLENITKLVGLAKAQCGQVEFVAEDATRADIAFLQKAVSAAEQSGATSVTLCDDAGLALPGDMEALLTKVREACKLPLFVRCSDAIHMAAACAAAAIGAGAAGVKVAMAGETALPTLQLAELAAARGADLGFETGLKTTELRRDLSELQKGLGHGEQEQTAGETGGSDIYLDAESTLADVCEAAKALGYELSDEDNGKVYKALLQVCEHKNALGARELEALIATNAQQAPATYHLMSYVANCTNLGTSMAQVTLARGEERLCGVSVGDGPIDSVFRAIEQCVGYHYELDDFQIQAVTEGKEALGSALVRLRSSGKLYSGNGISTDIVGASIRAYLNALNKIVFEEN